MVATSSTSTSLKEYLKKYTSNDNVEKKKKKRKRNTKPDNAGVLVVDEDPVWQKPVKPEEEEDSADEEKPQVDEDIDVKRMRRLEQLKSRRPYGAISEDGSGWVPVSDLSNNVKDDLNSDISPRRRRNDTPSPRTEEQPDFLQDADLSPPRQRRRQSPPQFETKRKARYDTPSPDPHRENSESDRLVTDLSPPRRQRREKHTLSPEPDRRSSYSKSTNSDISPPRRGHRDSKYQDSTRDLSPPRKVKNDRSDSVLSSRKSNHKLDGHESAGHAGSVTDLSPPRRRKGSPVLVNRPKTGLVSGGDIKEEIDKKKKEDWSRFQKMDPSVSGRDAEAIYRNKKTGERMSREEFLELKKTEKKKHEKPKEIKLEWGKGLAQKREAETRLQEIEAEKDKPFARSRDDPDLDKLLRDRPRFGDPMAHLVKNKNWEPVLPDLGDNEKMKESGFIIPQEIPVHSWRRRGLEAAPNRYGIIPGRHWDGVDRSNGYEKEFFKRTNEKKAMQQEAYKYSVADM
ncbi:hypothetical protein ACJIZ3_003474 [Penstemon smallii]|uniref:BUD13 homolog n=1 Tax=Penstemon smallii TaxID=265156 RepID=A0ABD3UAZ2_9LAMI